MRLEQLKSGMEFSANIYRELVTGVIEIEKGRLYLCQNERNGASCINKHGYRYSWVISRKKSNGHLDFENDDVSNFKITKVKPLEKLKRAFGYPITRRKGITKDRDQFIFGCGEVKVTRGELKNYLKIKNILKNREIRSNSAEKIINNLINE